MTKFGPRCAGAFAGFAGSCAAGLLLGVADAIGSSWTSTQALELDQSARWLALALASSAGFTIAFAVVLAAARLVRPGASRPRVAIAWACIALAGLLADKWLFVYRYPYMHELLALGYVTATVLAGPRKLPRALALTVTGLSVALAMLCPWLAPAFMTDDQSLRSLVVHRSTLARMALGRWTINDQVVPRCAWPAIETAAAATAPIAPRFNLLWLSMDAVRGDLGGPQLARAWPAILSALPDAFRFDAAHASATRTTESVLSMLTGRWPHRLDFRPSIVDADDQFLILPDDDPRLLDPGSWKQHHPLPIADNHPTLATTLKQAGYRTGAVATTVWFLPDAGLTRTFDEVNCAPYLGVRSGAISSEDFASAQTTDSLLEFVRAPNPEGRPWFAWAHYMDPHGPYRVAPGAPVPSDAPGRYFAEIQRADAEIGRLLRELENSGALAHTVVVITSDHGEEFRDHGGLLHGTTVYEELLHVPLLVRVPGIDAHHPRVVTRKVSLVDVLPTVLELLGVSAPQDIDGRSLVALLTGGSLAPRPMLGLATLHSRKAAVLAGSLKLIEEPSRGLIQLFDLGHDPHETNNLADTRAQDVASLRCLLWGSGIFDAASPRLAP